MQNCPTITWCFAFFNSYFSLFNESYTRQCAVYRVAIRTQYFASPGDGLVGSPRWGNAVKHLFPVICVPRREPGSENTCSRALPSLSYTSFFQQNQSPLSPEEVVRLLSCGSVTIYLSQRSWGRSSDAVQAFAREGGLHSDGCHAVCRTQRSAPSPLPNGGERPRSTSPKAKLWWR